MDIATLSMGWEKTIPEVSVMFQLGEKTEQGGKESKYTSFRSDTDERFKSLFVLQTLSASGKFYKLFLTNQGGLYGF